MYEASIKSIVARSNAGDADSLKRRKLGNQAKRRVPCPLSCYEGISSRRFHHDSLDILYQSHVPLILLRFARE